MEHFSWTNIYFTEKSVFKMEITFFLSNCAAPGKAGIVKHVFCGFVVVFIMVPPRRKLEKVFYSLFLRFFCGF